MKRTEGNLSIAFLFDDTLDSNDGVAQYVKTVGAWLSEQGHSVSYLVGETKISSWAGGEVYSLSRNRQVVFNGNRLSMPMPTSASRIRTILEHQDFDVLHVQVPYSPFMAKHVINSAESSTAVVGTFHILPAGQAARLGSYFLRTLLGRSLKRFDSMISVSRPAAVFAKKTFGIDSKVIPNVVNARLFAQASKPRSDHGSKKIVFLGRLVKRKGCLELLRAFSKLRQLLPGVRLIVAGDGPERPNLEKFVKKEKIDKSVKFLGYILEEDKSKLLAGADIACFPSLNGESFGIVLIEAMAAGARIVLGGNNPGYRSVLGQRPELLIDPRKPIEFSGRLYELLTDRPLVGELHKWQTSQTNKYEVSVVAPKIVEVYRQAIASRPERRHN